MRNPRPPFALRTNEAVAGARISFTSSARRLAGLAAVVAGGRPAEFWAATPAELEAVLAALAPVAAPPPAAAAITALKERFPDG